MYQAFLTVLRTPALRIATLTMFAMGFTYASTLPYLSLVGMDQLGLSEQQFGLILLGTAVLTMFGAVVISHFSDQATDRKTPILITLAVGAVGYSGFYLWPTTLSFIVMLLLFAPVAQATSPQLYAVVRSVTANFGSQEAASINAVIRALFAASWIVTPGLVGMLIAWTGRSSDAYGVAALAFLLCFGLYLWVGPRGGRLAKSEAGPIEGLLQAFRLVLSKPVVGRLGALAVIGLAQQVNATLLPIYITAEAGGGTREVGLVAGLTAGLEMPFMILAGWLVRRIPVVWVIALGGTVHAVYMFALAGTQAMGPIYLLALINAMGAAVLFSQHLSLLQDLMPDRPGLGTSLWSIEMLVMRGLGAAVVAGVGVAYGVSGAFVLAGAVGLMGVFVLLGVLQRRY